MTDSERAKAALAALAEGEGRDVAETARPATPSTVETTSTDRADYRRIIEQAVRATEDIEAAAEFAESVGLDRLETAVGRAEREVSGLASEGREALATFEEFRVAAAGPVE